MALTGKTIGELTYLSAATNNTLFPAELNGVTYRIPFSGMTGISGSSGTSGSSGVSGTSGSSGRSGSSGTSGINGSSGTSGSGVSGLSNTLFWKKGDPNTEGNLNIGPSNQYLGIQYFFINKTSLDISTNSASYSGNASSWLGSISNGDIVQFTLVTDTSKFGIYQVTGSTDFGSVIKFDVSTIAGNNIFGVNNGDNFSFSFSKKGNSGSSGTSGISGGSAIISKTYEELYSLYTGGTLSAGSYYLISDFQTCYDQPNFNENGAAITTGNYKTGTTEPIIVLAVTNDSISSKAISTVYPQDQILYDITFTTTEVTGGLAKGRITERIDEFNNRTDYDFRAVQFLRYEGFYSDRYYDGTLSIDGQGNVTGVGTQFDSDFSVGGILGVFKNNGANISCFDYYEILGITGSTSMSVTGRTISVISNTYYSDGITLPSYSSPFQCNVASAPYTGFTEYYTFDENSYGTYIGDNSQYDTFLLSNNVFKSFTYYGNILGDNSVGNTFDDDMDSNTFGAYTRYNIITNDFDRNTVGSYFEFNIIICDMEGNQIGERFGYNMIGDADGQDFDFNTIGSYFTSNFLTMNNNDFLANNIGHGFENNIIDSGFRYNTIVGNFYSNTILNAAFNSNVIQSTFYGNRITSSFYNNIIDINFYANTTTNTFANNKTGEDFFSNNILSSFTDNNTEFGFYDNEISGSTIQNNDFGFSFHNNLIYDCGFLNNTFVGNTTNNSFLSDSIINNSFNNSVTGNDVYYAFESNQIGKGFQDNNIGSPSTINGYDFTGNRIGDTFKSNQFVSGNTTSNVIGNDFLANTIYNNLQFNNIGAHCFLNTMNGEMKENVIGAYFQENSMVGTFQYNQIGSYFVSNIIGDGFGFGGGSYRGNVIGNNFFNNNIGEYFYDNTVGDNFTNNTVVDYFQMNRVCNSVESNDFSSSTFVYGYYNCEIFRNSAGTLRLSYYDSSDVLNITNITA